METADDLITSHMDYARALARQIHKGCACRFQFDDLESAAFLGLTRAAKAFDPARRVAFTTFAYRFIRGAVFDCLRKGTWLSPGDRARVRRDAAMEEAVESFSQELAPTGDPESLARQFSAMVRRLGTVIVMSSLRADESPADEAADAPPPDEPVCSAEVRERLREALRELSTDDMGLIDLLYIKGLSMEACGEQIGKDKATISRRHRAIIDRLRAALEQPPKRSTVPA